MKNTIDIAVNIERMKIDQMKMMLQRLYLIWKEVGIGEERVTDRANDVWAYVLDTLEDIIKEENGFYEDIKERIKNYKIKVSELSKILGVPEVEDEKSTLLDREEVLRHELDKLTKIVSTRKKTFQELLLAEVKYCTLLDMPRIKLSPTAGVPSEQDIYELEQHVKMLEQEKETRQKKFFILKRELTTIIEDTELPPETELEKAILTSNTDVQDGFSLSSETFKALEELLNKTKSKKLTLQNERKELMNRLNILWNRLKTSEEERKIFLEKYNDCKASTVNAIKKEIEKCEIIKNENMKEYINSLREELEKIWAKCFVSESTKNNFLRTYLNKIGEDVLEVYDAEASKWKEYYKNTEHILEKIKKRDKLWDLMVVLENKANDPNRFKNRGGQLLQEEKERRRLQKALPSLENEIFLDIEKYEEKFQNQFLYFGEDFRVFVTKQWEARSMQKENEKIQRQRKHMKELENEVTLGQTPSKRSLLVTPKSAPSKLFKSKLGVPIYRTPACSNSKKMPHTISKLKSNKTFMRKRDVKENAEPNIASGQSDTTTYTDFAEKLDRSSRIAYRSSVLSSRKIVGTRTSNSFKRKSVNRSIKKKDISKITPARGKLGLPFLI